MKATYLFLVLFTLCLGDRGVTILSPPEIAGEYLTGPLQLLPKTFEVEGEMVLVRSSCNFDGITDEDIASFNGKIVLFEVEQCKRHFGDKAKEAMKWNATAVVMPGTSGAVGQWYYNGDNYRSDVNIPSVSISGGEGVRLQNWYHANPGVKVYASVKNPDKNPWTIAANREGVFYQIAVLGGALVNLAFASYKLYKFISIRGFEPFSVTQLCLALEGMANLLNLIYGIDLYQYHGVFTTPAENVLFLLNVPFSLTATLLITFYWRDMLRNLSSYSNVSKNINRMKIPFYIVAILVWVLIIVSCIFRAGRIPIRDVSIVPIAITGIVSFSIGVFFSVTGYSVLRSLGQNEELRKSKSKTLRRVATYFIIVSFCLLLNGIYAFLFIVFSITMNYYPYQTMTYFWALTIIALIASAAQISVFLPPKSTDSASPQTSSNPKQDSSGKPATIELQTVTTTTQ